MLGVRISGVYEEMVSEPGRMKLLFQRGNSRRQTSSHRMNAVSSRSHAIFQIMIERRSNDSSATHVSTLNFVDLAGSERIEKSGNDYEALRTREANNINVSLLMLGNVISKLAERSVCSMQNVNRAGSPARTAQRSPDHIPYRNSKLTRLLQPSLGGNARTTIIATINPSADQVEETSHTLRLESRSALSATPFLVSSISQVVAHSDGCVIFKLLPCTLAVALNYILTTRHVSVFMSASFESHARILNTYMHVLQRQSSLLISAVFGHGWMGGGGAVRSAANKK